MFISDLVKTFCKRKYDWNDVEKGTEKLFLYNSLSHGLLSA